MRRSRSAAYEPRANRARAVATRRRHAPSFIDHWLAFTTQPCYSLRVALLRGVLQLTQSWRGRFILVVLLAQLLLPLHYYWQRRDPHDERFAWRMFSPMRMVQCTPQVQLDGAPYPLAATFHDAWLALARRGRFAVVEQMGAYLCARHPKSEVVVSLACAYQDAPARTWGGYNICRVPLL